MYPSLYCNIVIGFRRADQVPDLKWFKSSKSNDHELCVEVAFSDKGVLLRDSKNVSIAPLSFTTDEWNAFIGGAKNNEFDLA